MSHGYGNAHLRQDLDLLERLRASGRLRDLTRGEALRAIRQARAEDRRRQLAARRQTAPAPGEAPA
ncbi:hypothetical protein FBQ97_00805 [Acidobacteria bacterium ACD]|nr:hypothetical protein [Acidobacteria bacterium ACD]